MNSLELLKAAYPITYFLETYAWLILISLYIIFAVLFQYATSKSITWKSFKQGDIGLVILGPAGVTLILLFLFSQVVERHSPSSIAATATILDTKFTITPLIDHSGTIYAYKLAAPGQVTTQQVLGQTVSATYSSSVSLRPETIKQIEETARSQNVRFAAQLAALTKS